MARASTCRARTPRVRSFTALTALTALGVGLAWSTPGRADDGSNAVCPAKSAAADDVRERYDAEGRLVHQLRLMHGEVAEEVAVHYTGDHADARTELSPGHRRIARSYYRDDRVVVAECYEDGARVAYAAYRYDDAGHLLELDAWLHAGGGAFRRETTRYTYDPDGQVVSSEVFADGSRKSLTLADRATVAVPIQLVLSAGGSYQSDTELYDFTAGLGIHRRPKVQRYGSDPLEVSLDGVYKFHRAERVTSTDQTTLRFGVDYHDILPHITLFTFTSTDRNLPANLRLNLEEAVLGIKLDIVPPARYQLDASFAPVWNFRSIVSPQPDGGVTDETTSKLRGSFRARAGLHRPTWSLLETFELLPMIFGTDVAAEDGFWHRTVLRNTVSFDVALAKKLTFREEFKYTWDWAMRAQADCPDGSNPLCLGYAFASTTAIALDLDL
jgi:YD repeat-containing protein